MIERRSDRAVEKDKISRTKNFRYENNGEIQSTVNEQLKMKRNKIDVTRVREHGRGL